MKYRDDLEAAQNRIRELENRVEELQDGKPKPEAASAPTTDPQPPTNVAPAPRGCLYAGGGMSGLVLFILATITVGGRACLACNSDVTDPALAAAKACPTVKEVLGDDIGWSMIGCSNYESESGGDPINSGCHSSATFHAPIGGTKARGSYQFSSSQPPGKPNRFNGGSIFLSDGTYISISHDGTCGPRNSRF